MSEKSAYHHGNLEEALIKKGLESLEKDGLEALSLRAITESLGVSRAAPYRHFRTKRDLLAALAAEGYHLFANTMESWEQGAKSQDPGAVLGSLYSCYRDFVVLRPELYRLMFSRLGNSLHSERCRENAQRAFSVLYRISVLIQGPAVEPQPLVMSLYASLHGWAMLMLDDLIPPQTGVIPTEWTKYQMLPGFAGSIESNLKP